METSFKLRSRTDCKKLLESEIILGIKKAKNTMKEVFSRLRHLIQNIQERYFEAYEHSDTEELTSS